MAMAGGGGGDVSPDDDVTLIFVYGTLKRGFYNHTLLDDLIRTGGAAYLGPCTTVVPFPLVCGPHGIPYLVNLPESGLRVRGELYKVSSVHGRARLDELEGLERGHYERLAVAVAVAEGGGERSVDAEAYFAHRGFGEKLWKRCGEVGLGEYDLEMGKRYVRREDRPLDYNFIDDIHKFILEACGLMARSSSDRDKEWRSINSCSAISFHPFEKIELAQPSNPIMQNWYNWNAGFRDATCSEGKEYEPFQSTLHVETSYQAEWRTQIVRIYI